MAIQRITFEYKKSPAQGRALGFLVAGRALYVSNALQTPRYIRNLAYPWNVFLSEVRAGTANSGHYRLDRRRLF